MGDDVVRLRPMVDRDRAAVFAVLSSDPEISRWTRIPWPYEQFHLDQFFGMIATWGRGSTDAVWAITTPDDDTALGCIGAHRIGGAVRPRSSFLPDEPGYWLTRAARGRGLMTHALGLVCDWLLDERQRPQVNIQTKVGNTASRGVIERVGFRFVEMVAADAVDDDIVPTDHDRFVLTPADRARATSARPGA
jgi:RimJ/RimL family protein N-acetyltransferase